MFFQKAAVSLGVPVVFCSCRVASTAVSRRSVSVMRLGCMPSWDLLGGERSCADRLGLGAVWAFLDSCDSGLLVLLQACDSRCERVSGSAGVDGGVGVVRWVALLGC